MGFSGEDSIGLQADVLLDFTQTTNNINDFVASMREFDDAFGNIDDRIRTLRNSLSSLSGDNGVLSANTLRDRIEQQVNLALQSEVIFEKMGNKPINIKKDTLNNIYSKVNSELNAVMLQQAESIKIEIDPSYRNNAIPLGSQQMGALNKEIANLIKTQVSNMTESFKKGQSGQALSDDALNNVALEVSKTSVRSIVASIKRQIMPIILNPTVDIQEQTLQFTDKDINRLREEIYNRIKDSLRIDLKDTDANMSSSLNSIAKTIDKEVLNYTKSIKDGIQTIDPSATRVSLTDMSQRVQRMMAKSMGISLEELQTESPRLKYSDVMGAEMQRQVSALDKVVTDKLSKGMSSISKNIKERLNEVNITDSKEVGTLQQHIIRELTKINNQIVNKVRETVDMQFQALRQSVDSVNVEPSQLKREAKLRSIANGGSRQVNNYSTTNIINNQRSTDSYAGDPYARRDNYYNGFGLEGAITNTVRHIIAGSMVGAPMMAVYSALESFKTVQEEQLKVMQNMALKDEYRTDGNTNWGKVQVDSTSLMSNVRGLSNFYALEYSQMAQVAAIASRLTEDKQGAQQFTDQAAKIYRLDNESDLVGTIAPGLEAIMAQFGLSVWELDNVVKAFAVATNKTKATSDDIIKAMMRSGSALNSSGVTAEQAIALNAIMIQRSGLSGENIGNALKTVAARASMPSVVNGLAGKGIDVYKTNEMGLREKKSLIEILQDIAKISNGQYTGGDETAKMLLDIGGGYQYSKIMPVLQDMVKDGGSQLNFDKIMVDIESMTDERLATMLTKTMESPTVIMQRSGISVTNALTSILDEMSPEIIRLSRNITNLSGAVEDNADKIAAVINILVDALVGFAGLQGIKYIGSKTGYAEKKAQADLMQGYMGGTYLRNNPMIAGLDEKSNTGRRYGGVDFVATHMLRKDDEGKKIADTMRSKQFYNLAINNSMLRGYMEELAALNDTRRRELRRYVQDFGEAESIADVFAIMDESRGYRRNKTQNTNDIISRADKSIEFINSKQSLEVFSKEFAYELSDAIRMASLGDDRTNGVATKYLNMDDSKRNNFNTYLATNVKEGGFEVTDFETLSAKMDEYQERNKKMVRTNRDSMDSFYDLRKSVYFVADEMENGAKKGRSSFMKFLDDIPSKSRAAAGAIKTLSASFASISWQLAALAAVGDVITTLSSNALLTDSQKEIEEFRTKNNKDTDKGMKYLDAMDKNVFEKDFLSGSVSAFWDTGIFLLSDLYGRGFNIFTGTKSKEVATDDIFKLNTWATEKYGGSTIIGALANANKQAKKADPNARELTYQDLGKMYLDETGKTQKLTELEQKNFLEEYKKSAVAEAEAETRRLKEQAAKDAWSKEARARGELEYFTSDAINESISSDTSTIQAEQNANQLKSLINGYKSDSAEYMKIRIDAIKKEQKLYKDWITDFKEYVAMLDSGLIELENAGKRYKLDENGNMIKKDDGTYEETSEYTIQKEAAESNRTRLNDLQKEFQPKIDELELEKNKLVIDTAVASVNKEVSRISSLRNYRDTLDSLSMDTTSRNYLDSKLINAQDSIRAMKEQLAIFKDEIKGQLDPDDKITDAITSLEQQIASAQVEVKNLRLQRLTSWKEPFNDKLEYVDIKYLQKQVALGGVSSDSPILQNLRISEYNDRLAIITSELAGRRKELSSANNEEEINQINKDIRDLTKQSLQTQISIQQELKNISGGTFNLPDGVRALTEFDYMASKSTHSNFSIQSGDMYVNVTLPNVTSNMSSQELASIGATLGKGIAQGRNVQLRNQLSGNPYAYRTY